MRLLLMCNPPSPAEKVEKEEEFNPPAGCIHTIVPVSTTEELEKQLAHIRQVIQTLQLDRKKILDSAKKEISEHNSKVDKRVEANGRLAKEKAGLEKTRSDRRKEEYRQNIKKIEAELETMKNYPLDWRDYPNQDDDENLFQTQLEYIHRALLSRLAIRGK